MKSAGFNDSEIKTMQAVSEDLDRAQIATQGIKLPTGSNTPQDALITLLKAVGNKRALAGEAALFTGGLAVGGPVGGMAAGTVGALVNVLRQAGLQNVESIVREMLLDPKFAAEMLRKYPQSDVPASALRNITGALIKVPLVTIRTR